MLHLPVPLLQESYLLHPKNEITFSVEGDYIPSNVQSVVFDAEYYAANNSDVIAGYGNTREGLYKHFIDHGVSEGRQGSAVFSVKDFVEKNASVKSLYGGTTPDYKSAIIYFGNTAAFNDTTLYKTATPENMGSSFSSKIALTNASLNFSLSDTDVIAYTPSSAAAQIYNFERQSDGTYKAVNTKNNYVLEIASNSKASGTNVQIGEDTGANTQRWNIFKNYDGTENIVWGEFQYGWSIEGLTAQANKAAQNSREDDPVYDYIFIGWDKTVPTFCEGHDMVFIAQYKAVYKYYDAKWYNSTAIKNSDGDIIGWAADKSTHEDENGDDVETNLLATTKHTYDSKLYTPSVDAFTCLETAPAGQNFVFAGWCYDIKDEDGNVIETKKYERGMKITAGMEFYATYTLTAKTFTVTAMVDGKPTYYTVASGDTVNLADPQDGYVDDTYHNEFIGWSNDADGNDEFKADTGARLTGILLDKGECFDFSLQKFADTIYRTSELLEDSIVTRIIEERIN